MSISTVEQAGSLAAGEKSAPIRLDLYTARAQSLIRVSITSDQDCVIHASYGSNLTPYLNPDADAEDLTDEDYGGLPHEMEEQDHDAGSMGYEIPVNWAARRFEFQVENTSGSTMEYRISVGSGNE